MPSHLADLLRIVARLRDPVHGCPWDRVQTFETVAPYAVEEAYEVLDAVERQDLQGLRSELGDLLLQVVFQARIAEEGGLFTFPDVVRAVTEKLIRRHPHVFDAQGGFLDTDTRGMTVADVERAWEAGKAEERASGGSGDLPAHRAMLSDTVAATLPALSRAGKISRAAAAHGFDWPDAGSVVAKVREEVDEVEEALGSGDRAAVSEEIGDLLFSVANLARHAGIDPKAALRTGTAKFERRFEAMARRLAEQGDGLEAADLAGMEAAWAAVKRAERKG